MSNDETKINKRHGRTSHGHECCDEAPAGKPPFARARCGGPILCSTCRGEANDLHSAPRSWSLPAEPGPEVTRLRDYEGNEWHRVERGWAPVDQRYSQIGVPWSSMVFTYAPLTDATPVAASPVSDKEGS